MKLYKLTNSYGYTHGDTKWDVGTKLTLPKISNPKLCSNMVIHAYKNINLALLLNPIHANFINPLVWESKGQICCQDWGKVGCFQLTITKKLNLPAWTTDIRVRVNVSVLFSILCAKSVLNLYEKKYPQDFRSRNAIETAEKCILNNNAADAYTDAHTAAHAAADATAYAAAYAAADAAAYAAAHAADAAAADAAAYAAAYAAYTAADADAADAADAADLNFSKLANLAVKLEVNKK